MNFSTSPPRCTTGATMHSKHSSSSVINSLPGVTSASAVKPRRSVKNTMASTLCTSPRCTVPA